VLDDKPLIYYAINISKKSSLIDKTVVTTNDKEIAQIAKYFGVDQVVTRPEDLADDETPLSPVIKHAYIEQEEKYDFVLSFQPTTPLISVKSLDQGIKKGLENNADSVIFTTDATAHYWKGKNSDMELLSSARKNRQYMEKIFEEIGIFLTRKDVITDGKRIGKNPLFKEVNKREGIDIDDYGDWILAENYLKRKLLIYRVIGNSDTGLGHISRGITLAKQIHEHDVLFGVSREDDLAKQLLQDNNFPFFEFENEKDFENIIKNKKPDILVNDILDTTKEYMDCMRDKVDRIINFEDMGEGSEIADIVINALYEFSTPPTNHFYGHKYVCLRDEFRYMNTKSNIDDVERIMISFGGVDENNMTLKSLKAIVELIEENDDLDITTDIVLGLGYKYIEELNRYIKTIPNHIKIKVSQNINRMSDHMLKADLLLTSNGRTIYEATSMNLPVISTSQNQRETKHLFSHICRGIWDLGLADFTSKENLKVAITEYVRNKDKRNFMYESLDTFDIRNGIKRVKNLIFD